MTLFLSLILSLTPEAEFFETDIVLSKIYIAPEIFDNLLKNPLAINSADYDDLSLIPYLTPKIVKAILNYRQEHGKFKNLNELLSIEGIDQELLDKVRQFLTINPNPVKPKMEMKFRVMNDSLANNYDFKDWALFNRLKIDYGNWGLVLITDKDAQELSLFDFIGTSIAYADKRQQLIIGNYLLDFGKGLILAKPFYQLRPAKALADFKTKEIMPLTSPVENNSLFGFACQKTFGNLRLIGFFSTNWLDAEIDTNGIVKRLIYDGKHIDSATKASQDRLREDLFGARWEYRILGLRLGSTCYHNHYSYRFVPSDSTNSFFGNQITLYGIDWSLLINNYYGYGELGYCLGKGFGFALGILGDWKQFKVQWQLTSTQKNFYSPHSQNFSLTNKKDNLSGKLNLYYNFFRFKTFLEGTTKTDFVLDSLPAKIEAGFSRSEGKLDIALSYKRAFKDDVSKSQGTRLDLAYPLSKQFALGLRIEDHHVLQKLGRGILLRFGTNLSFGGLGYTAQFYWFSVTTAEARIFAYEPGFGSLGNNQSLLGKGIRYFSFLSYKRRPFRAGLKFGITKTDRLNFDAASQIEINL